MARVTPQQWLEKWGRKLQASGADITAGVNNVKTAPGQLAAQSADRALAALTEAFTSGRWQNAVAGVSLTDWQNAMKNKGIPRIAQGVTTAQQTRAPEIAALLSAVDNSVAAISNLPKGGLENNIARSTAYMRAMSANAPKRNR